MTTVHIEIQTIRDGLAVSHNESKEMGVAFNKELEELATIKKWVKELDESTIPSLKDEVTKNSKFIWLITKIGAGIVTFIPITIILIEKFWS